MVTVSRLTARRRRLFPERSPDPCWRSFGIAIVAVALAVSLVLSWPAFTRPLIDGHGFRQTQTAMTVFWLLKEGPWWDYQTPLLGAGWSIPFEFPLYQWIVAAVVRISGAPIDVAGRVVSYLWLIVGLWPVRIAASALKVPPPAFACYAVLTLLSPVYLFWGRTFLIETQAIAFGWAMLAAVLCYNRRPGALHLLAAALAGTAAALTKITTILPFCFLAGIATLVRFWPKPRGMAFAIARILPIAIAVAAGLIAFFVWNRHADAIKATSILTTSLASTSAELKAWNFGTIGQRFGAPMLKILLRATVDIGGLLGPLIAMLLLAWIGFGAKSDRRLRLIALALVVAWALPFLIFTNLHFAHNYYQAGNAALLIAAIAIGVAALVARTTVPVAVAIIAVLAGSQLHRYSSAATRHANPRAQMEREIGLAVRDLAPPGSAIIVTGLGWSPILPYHAQRKAVMVRDDQPMALSRSILADPARFTGGLPIGAIVRCPSPLDQDAVAKAALDRLTAGRNSRTIPVCTIYW